MNEETLTIRELTALLKIGETSCAMVRRGELPGFKVRDQVAVPAGGRWRVEWREDSSPGRCSREEAMSLRPAANKPQLQRDTSPSEMAGVQEVPLRRVHVEFDGFGPAAEQCRDDVPQSAGGD